MHLTRSSRCEPSLLRQTKCWSWPRGKTICRCVTSNAAAFYCYGATKELQLRPSLLHLRPPPSRWTLWSKVATERAWKQRGDRRFPSACWLHLYTNGLFHASDVWTERFVSVFLARRSDITDGFLSDIRKGFHSLLLVTPHSCSQLSSFFIDLTNTPAEFQGFSQILGSTRASWVRIVCWRSSFTSDQSLKFCFASFTVDLRRRESRDFCSQMNVSQLYPSLSVSVTQQQLVRNIFPLSDGNFGETGLLIVSLEHHPDV